MLQAGFARLDITPPFGLSLAGYFRDRKADGILDPIELNAIAVKNDTDTVLLIAADLIKSTPPPDFSNTNTNTDTTKKVMSAF